MKDRILSLTDRQCRQVLIFLYGSYLSCPTGRGFMERLRDGVEWMEKSRVTEVQSMDVEMSR